MSAADKQVIKCRRESCSWAPAGKSAKLFIGLMGCRLQYNSRYYLTEAPEWSAATNGLAIRGCSDARWSHQLIGILKKSPEDSDAVKHGEANKAERTS